MRGRAKKARRLASRADSAGVATATLASGTRGGTAADVKSGLTLIWSNGQVEGQVHRLTLLKRQAYGRASFETLRKRVLRRA